LRKYFHYCLALEGLDVDKGPINSIYPFALRKITLYQPLCQQFALIFSFPFSNFSSNGNSVCLNVFSCNTLKIRLCCEHKFHDSVSVKYNWHSIEFYLLCKTIFELCNSLTYINFCWKFLKFQFFYE
jgi:hypothetical protein